MSSYSKPVGPVTATSGVAAALAWTVQPTNTAVNAVITPSPTVQLVDATGEPVAQAGVQVTVTLSPGSFAAGSATQGRSDPPGSMPFGILKVAADGSYTMTASAAGLKSSPPSVLFTVGTPAPPPAALTSVGLARTTKDGAVVYVLSGKPGLSGTYTNRATALAALEKEAARIP